MLCRESAELAEGLSRLCVLRTEDYQLLKSIRKTQKQKPDPEYLALLLVEFRKREQWRSDREVELLAQLGAWEYGFYSESRFTEGVQWKALGQFQPVYIECIRATYHLEPKDLKESPFVTMDSSQYLYACGKASPLRNLGYAEVLNLFGPPTKDESAVHAEVLVDTLYPLQRDLGEVPDMIDEDLPLNSVRSNPVDYSVSQMKEDLINIHVKPSIRSSLRASLKVWQVLFLLWKHLLMRCPLDDSIEGSDRIFRTISITTGNFLNTQRCRFTSLLESVDSMHQK